MSCSITTALVRVGVGTVERDPYMISAVVVDINSDGVDAEEVDIGSRTERSGPLEFFEERR